MEQVGIVVDDLRAAVEFFVQLGLEPRVNEQVEGQLGGPDRRARRLPGFSVG
jgi:catechol 2,3-dioxygenase-like lactoylglutathione lyase family enzyme